LIEVIYQPLILNYSLRYAVAWLGKIYNIIVWNHLLQQPRHGVLIVVHPSKHKGVAKDIYGPRLMSFGVSRRPDSSLWHSEGKRKCFRTECYSYSILAGYRCIAELFVRHKKRHRIGRESGDRSS